MILQDMLTVLKGSTKSTFANKFPIYLLQQIYVIVATFTAYLHYTQV